MASEASAPQQPSPPIASKIRGDTVQRAVDALLKWQASKSEDEKLLLIPQDDFVYLNLTLKKIPEKARTNAFRISLPHPLHDSSSQLCLIVDDRLKSQLTSKDAKKIIKAEGIPISKVIKFSKLKTDYKPFEAKRKLCDSYDAFFTDRRVVPLLPKLLGKHFFKKKKLPLPLDLTHKNWKGQIERACASGLLFFREGTCCVVKVGKLSMENEEIVQNVAAAIEGIIEFVPKKWAGVRSLHLKFSGSVALPLYQAMPDIKLRIEGIRHSGEGDEEGRGSEVEAKDGNERREKLGKKGNKKGRIHEVRYMDTSVSQDMDEIKLNDNEDATESEMDEDYELGSPVLQKTKRKKRDKLKDVKSCEQDDTMVGLGFEGKKTRKKGMSAKEQIPIDLNGEKLATKSSKVEKEKGHKQEKDELALRRRDESGGNKRKEKRRAGDDAVEVSKDKKTKKK